MAASTLESTSTAVDSNNKRCYSVFINHRGPDVKKTFTSHLYHRLQSHGLGVFLDKEEMEKGENLTSQIQGVIRAASVHVVIFSKGYADSSSCLDELLLMWGSKSGATILPIFYGVKPADLRWTQGKSDGVYAQALRKLQEKKQHDFQTQQEKPRYDSTTIENWRKALSSVSEISGLELEAFNGEEGKLLDEVVQHVLKKVKNPLLKVAKYPTGLDEKVEDIQRTVFSQQRIGKPQVVGIVGLGGIGKTTLATELFNRNSSDYSLSCFLYEVRENAKKRSLVLLQSKLLEDLTRSIVTIESVEQGIEMLRNHLSSSHALLVLDDVDHIDQLDVLLPAINVLDPNSLVLITSRDKHVLISAGVEDSFIYKLNGLNIQHSRELFCLHAFWQPSPLAGFDYLVDKFRIACDGLPLLLKVFGAFLYGNNRKLYWEDLLDELQELRDTHIKLNILYDALSGEEQQIFLDVACFFIGEDRDSAIRIWDGSGWKGLQRFQNLEDRCLVEVDNENKITMHDCLISLGRDLAKHSEFPCRLWHETLVKIDDLLEPSSVSTTEPFETLVKIDDLLEPSSLRTGVRGIKMRPGYKDDDFACFPSYKGRKLQLPDQLQLLDIEGDLSESIGHSPNLIWFRWLKCPYSSLPSWIPMKNLRVLEVVGSILKTLWQRESQAPSQLRELRITSPLSEIPKSIGQLKHLERIQLSNLIGDTLEELPEEFCNLQSLKALALLDCSNMKVLPDSFGNLTNLEHIDLSGSDSLQMLPNSFGNLIRLKYLVLKGCHNLTISYATIAHVSSLEHLNLSACKKIEILPLEVSEQRDLKKLYLCGMELKKLPSAIGDLSNLELLELGSPSLEMLPRSLGDLKRLKDLTLLNCRKLKRLPDSVGLLIQLTRMTVEDCNLRKIEGLCGLAKLERLKIRSCKELEELPGMETLVSLQGLWADECVKLKRIKGLAPLTKLRVLDVRNCSELEEIEGVEHCISLQRLYASGCPKLQWGGGAGQLRQRLKERDSTM